MNSTLVMTYAAPRPAGADLTLLVAAKELIAQDIHLFKLVAPPGSSLPPFTAGAHIVVRTPAGLWRQYSLCNAPHDTDRYLIAVKREELGQGGSRSMVDAVQVGQELKASTPINHFELQPAARTLLVAGGIGITPILAMAYELVRCVREFQLLYCARSAAATAFHDLLRTDAALAPHTTIHHDHGDRAQAFDFESLLALQSPGTHVYCCGPSALMQVVRDLTRNWPAGCVHFEEFSPAKEQDVRDGDAAFVVKLARRGAEVRVPPGMSILQVLREEGFLVSSSCESGTCSACRTTVLRGVPDHRCYVMDEDDESEIMLCVSRARTPELVLDL